MKRIELFEMAQNLDKVRQKGSKFCYAITKNKYKLQKEIRDMEKVIEPSTEYKEFANEMEKLKKELAKKDDMGNPLIIQRMGPNGQPASFYDIDGVDDPKSEFNIRKDEIKNNYLEAIEEHENKIKDYRENLLQEEVDFPFHKIRLSDVPVDISQEEMDVIFPFTTTDDE